LISRKNEQSPYIEYHRKELDYSHNLRLFGEDGVKLMKLYDLPDILSNIGTRCLLLGFQRTITGRDSKLKSLDRKNLMFLTHTKLIGISLELEEELPEVRFFSRCKRKKLLRKF
jgi:hypothetical protein